MPSTELEVKITVPWPLYIAYGKDATVVHTMYAILYSGRSLFCIT
jgi:hypothetical protein